MADITKIVITGGPCGGKSTAMSWIQNRFSELGYTVLFVPETATELISSGVAPWTCNTNLDYQTCQMTLQMEKEKIFLQAAEHMPGDKFLIVCDRGELDNKAYMTDEEFSTLMERLGWNETQLRDGYDAVFHLVTAAKGAEEFYTTANNAARYETVEEAAAMDDRLIAAWTGHPHFRIIDNSTDFEGKMVRLLSELVSFLGEPEPYEIDRRFLIEYPDIEALEKDPSCRKVEIMQTYLKSDPGTEVRVRQRGIDGSYIYYRTTKRQVSDMKYIVLEKRLTPHEYLEAMMEADITRRQIRKTRYCLTRGGQYIEIDVYPFWDDQAIMEIKLEREDQEFTVPEPFRVIREVTGDPAYKVAALAKI